MSADSQPSMTMGLHSNRGVSASRRLAYGLAVIAVLSCVVTAVLLVSQPADQLNIELILGLLYFDGAILVLLGAVIARRLYDVWRRRRQAGSRLQARLIILFGLVATAPALLVALISAFFINYGMQAWFNERVSSALNQSVGVARAYLEEHREGFSADILAVASDLNFQAPLLTREPWRMGGRLTALTTTRGLTEAVIIDQTGQVVARSDFSLPRDSVNIPDGSIEEAGQGQMVLLPLETPDRVRGMVKLSSYLDAYLIVERFVNPEVLNYVERIQTAVEEYLRLEEERGGLQVSFMAIFVIVAVLLLLAAVWTGLTVSGQLVEPVGRLIRAAEQVREGDLGAKVETSDGDDDIALLGRAFNRMTDQIVTQQDGLITANRELDERRRFTETVLAGVSAGVVGLDADGRINLPNRRASDLLNTPLGVHIGADFGAVVPEMAELLAAAMARPDRLQQSELRIDRQGRHAVLLARVAAERLSGDVIGYVVTFDDVTELMSAQRKAAWADVARRIAHEIKNPLTPIQLSADRLKRRFGDAEGEQRDIINRCTETIIRQVEDIGRMVDEFSSFARMPQPSLNPEDIRRFVEESIYLERNRNPDIRFDVTLPETAVTVRCDRNQVSRALMNILKNAAESVETAVETRNEPDTKNTGGNIRLTVIDSRPTVIGEFEKSAPEAGKEVSNPSIAGEEGHVAIIIEDNGLGLPVEDRHRLTEPYVTTRAKGTGLGLAIVKKIMEDHRGELILENRAVGGARITLIFRDLDEVENDPKDEDPMKTMTNLVAGV